MEPKYRKSSKETLGSYFSSSTAFAGLVRVCIGKISKNAGLIRIWVLFEGGSLSRIYGSLTGLTSMSGLTGLTGSTGFDWLELIWTRKKRL